MFILRFIAVFALAAILPASGAPGPGLPACPMLANWDGAPRGFRGLGWSGAPGPGLPACPVLASWDGAPRGFRGLGWSAGQPPAATPQPKPAQKDTPSHPAEDISGMYSFLNEGEFLQINVEGDAVSGYVSRMGSLESDRGLFLDQFFDKASIQDHDVAFVTKVVHGVWYEFKGRFDRGNGKNKGDDAYYVLKGTLTEYTMAPDKTSTSRARQVEFKSMALPQDIEQNKASKKK